MDNSEFNHWADCPECKKRVPCILKIQALVFHPFSLVINYFVCQNNHHFKKMYRHEQKSEQIIVP
jgi:hypothetical protein